MQGCRKGGAWVCYSTPKIQVQSLQCHQQSLCHYGVSIMASIIGFDTIIVSWSENSILSKSVCAAMTITGYNTQTMVGTKFCPFYAIEHPGYSRGGLRHF